jgi:hypothetical protein
MDGTLKTNLKLESWKPSDPHHTAAVERGKEAVRRLIEAGIIDAEGLRIRTDLPGDMRPGNSQELGD